MADISALNVPAGIRPTAGAPPGRGSGPGQPLWRQVLGGLLRRLRHQRGLTLGEVADRAGLSPQYLSEIERGLKDPSSEMIEAVAGALGVTLVDLTLAAAETLILSSGSAPAAQLAAGRTSRNSYRLAA